MPSIDKSFLEKLQDNFTNYPIFIETGTHIGTTTFACEPYFEKIYTIEIDKRMHRDLTSRYVGNKIDFLLGDSCEIFPTLLPKVTDPTIFFLDGHWSGRGTGRGAKDCPLLEEVSLISKLFQHEAIVVIDDYRLFGKCPRLGTGNGDWEEITQQKILDILMPRYLNSYILDSPISPQDRLIIHISKHPSSRSFSVQEESHSSDVQVLQSKTTEAAPNDLSTSWDHEVQNLP